MPRAALSKVSITQLVAELNKRKSKLAEMITQRDALTVQIDELQGLAGAEAPASTASAPAPKAAKRGKKGRRAMGKPLAEYVHAVLAATEEGLNVKEIEAKVRAAGYPTTAKTLYVPIMKVLSKGFKKVERGVYAVAGRAEKKTAAKAEKDPTAKRKKPAKFKMSAEQMILALLKGKSLTSTNINIAWKKAGRAGTASVTLGKMAKAKMLKREPLAKGQKGFAYTATPAPF